MWYYTHLSYTIKQVCKFFELFILIVSFVPSLFLLYFNLKFMKDIN